MKVRAPAWTLAMVGVVADVERLERGPLRGYEGEHPRVKLTWGDDRSRWSAIEREDFLHFCEEAR